MKKGQPLRHGLVYGRYFKRGGRHGPAARASRASASTTCGTRARRSASPPGRTLSSSPRASGTPPSQITLDRYGHLFPSVEEALAEQLDAAFAAGQQSEPATSNVVVLR